jgi:LysM repeat protein
MIENSENIVVEINQRTKIDEGSANIETWSPLKDGKIFRSYLESKDKISDKDKKKLEDDTVYLLGRCINPKKIKETNLDSTGVGFGQVQSGKTTSMESVFHLAADNNFRVLILLTGYVGPLVEQNTSRLDNILNDRKFEVMLNVGQKKINNLTNLDILKANLKDWLDDEIDEKEKQTIVILSMKNPSRIRNITKLFQDACDGNNSKYSKIPVLIIDDESDHHSLNTKAAKNDPENKNESELYEIQKEDTLEIIAKKTNLTADELCEINPEMDLVNNFKDYIGEKINKVLLGTATHLAITNLRKLFKFHSFIGYSATPNETFLISTFNNLNPSFGRVLESGESYTGLEYFFSSRSKIDRFVKPIEIDISNYEDEKKRPDSFKDAYIYFLTCVASAMCLEKHNRVPRENMSMIIHPSQKRDIHQIYINWIKGLQDEIAIAINDKNSDEFKELELKIKDNLDEINKYSEKKILYQNEKFWNYFKSAKCLGRTPERFNAQDGSIPRINYQSYANILVGGSGLDRGLTVEGLTVTFLSRALGNRQEATLTQRARFLGYQGVNSAFLRIYMTQENQNFFEDVYEMNESNMRQLRLIFESGQNLKDWQPIFFGEGRGKYKVARPSLLSDKILVSRNKPYPKSIRCGYAHLLDEKKTEINKTIYNILTTHEEFLKITKKLKDVNDFSNTHPWIKNQNISVLDELSLHDAMELFLNKFKYEPRDLENFGSALLLIKHFMNPIKNKNENEEQYENRVEERKKIKCPIFIFRKGDNSTRKPYSSEDNSGSYDEILQGRVTSAQGESEKFKEKSHLDKTLFPGDRRIHWDFMKGISNDEQALVHPSIQIHDLTITEKLNGEGKKIENIPFISLFVPIAFFSEHVASVNRRQ